MPVIYTSIARVRDWQALRRLGREALQEQARRLGATGYRMYRNVRDASQMLVVAEFPDADSVDELGRELHHVIAEALAGGAADERAWEPADVDEPA